MKNGLLGDHYNDQLIWFKRGLAVLAILSTVFTYNGADLLRDAADWYDKAIAAGVAMASGVTIYLIWTTLFRAVADEQTVPQLAVAALKIVLAVPLIAAASTWLMVGGFAEQDIDRTHKQAYLVEAETATAEAYGDALTIGDLETQVKALAASLQKWGTLEQKTGLSTGIPGDGAVSDSLFGIAGRLEELVGTLASSKLNVETQKAGASTALARMRETALGRGAAQDRDRNFAAADERWRTAVLHMNTERAAQTAIDRLRAEARDFGAVVKLSGKRAVRKKQVAALDKYRNVIGLRVDGIANGAQSQAMTTVSLPTLAPLSVVLGVLVYWDQYIAYWILGFGIDFGAPLIMLLSLHAAVATRSAQERFASELLNMPARSFLMVEYYENLKRRIALDENSAQSINDRLIGKSEYEVDNDGRGDGDG